MNERQNKTAPKPHAREIIIAALACIMLSYIAAWSHWVMVDRHAAADIAKFHHQVLAGEATSPMQYRPGAYLIAEGLKNLFNLEIITAAYYYERMLFMFTAGLFAYLFFRRFLPAGWSLAGLGWFYAILPFTYLGYTHQPADPINATIYTLAYLAAATGASLWIIPLAGVGAFFRETAILLPILGLITDWGKRPAGATIVRFVVGAIAAAAVILAIHNFYGPREHPDEWLMLMSNLRDARWPHYLAVLILPPAASALWGWRRLGPFLKRSLLFVLLFLVIHFIFGRFSETRLYLPVLPPLIASALCALKWRLE